MAGRNRLPHWLRGKKEKKVKNAGGRPQSVEFRGENRPTDAAWIVCMTPAGQKNKEAWCFDGKVLVFQDLETAKVAYKYQIEQRDLGRHSSDTVVEILGFSAAAIAQFSVGIPTLSVADVEALRQLVQKKHS